VSLVACAGDPAPRDEPAPRADDPRATAPADAAAPDAAAPDDCLGAAAVLSDADAAVARALCADLRNLSVPGAAVVVARRGQTVLRFAAGVRCRGGSDRVGPHTGFRVGSLTKAITAATAFALAERGDVAITDAIGPAPLRALGLPEALASATLGDLLDHRAGLDDYLPHEALRNEPPARQLAALVGHPRDGDASWRYANGGYALVGALLERSSGASWASLVQREITGPLAMVDARTTADPSGDVACGHLRLGETLTAFDVRADYDRFAFGVEVAAPSGAIVASAVDLAIFGNALAGFGPQPRGIVAMREAILERARPTGRGDERYAAGMSLQRNAAGARVVRHAGATGDFWAELVWLVDAEAVVAVAGNRGVPLAATLAAAIQRAGVDPRR
jgi:CubicO group peptidase (beta-lactamase class C family)